MTTYKYLDPYLIKYPRVFSSPKTTLSVVYNGHGQATMTVCNYDGRFTLIENFIPADRMGWIVDDFERWHRNLNSFLSIPNLKRIRGWSPFSTKD